MSLEPGICYRVLPFTRVVEGEDVVIGLPGTSSFLAVSRDIVAILDWLDDGKSLAEARELYERSFGDAEDLPGAVEILAAKGFLLPDSLERPSGSGEERDTSGAASRSPLTLVSKFYGPMGLSLQVAFLALAGALLWLDSGLIPGIRVLFFERHVTLTSLAVIVLSLSTLALHELAHIAAAWRKGVRSRLGVSHRLWMPVVETDLSGLWSLPRRERFIPILAGPLADGVFCSLMILLLFGERRGWIRFGDLGESLLQAILVISVFRILWQCLLFVRTDFYYALAHLMGCKNLMTDTEEYLRGLGKSALRRHAFPGLTRLPLSERRAVRAYSVLWLLGRLLALIFLGMVQIPLMLHYLGLFLHAVAGQPARSLYQVADTFIVALFVLLVNGMGFGLWIHNLLQRGSQIGPS